MKIKGTFRKFFALLLLMVLVSPLASYLPGIETVYGQELPSLSLDVSSGPAGEVLKASGASFVNSGCVNLFFDESFLMLETVIEGSFSAAIMIPSDATPGDHLVTAEGLLPDVEFCGGPSDEVAAAIFTVVPSRVPIPGQVLVGFTRPVTEQEVQQILDSLDGAVIGSHASLLRLIPRINFAIVGVTPGEEEELIGALLQVDIVASAERDFFAETHLVPTDPSYASEQSWHYDTDRVNMEAAWDVTLGNPAVIVAVADSGVDVDVNNDGIVGDVHADLAGNLLVLPGADIINSDDNPDDDNQHGTHVAGTIAALMNNGIGGTGVAPQVRVMPVKVLNDVDGIPGGQATGSFGAISAGIVFAVDNGADIINLSLGAPGCFAVAALVAALTYADDNNVLSVISAGNSAAGVGTPACYTDRMAVSATDQFNTLASYSNSGPEVNIAAPGGDRLDGGTPGLDEPGTNEGVFSSLLAGGFGWLSGTSMAAPHVSGCAALVKSLNPGFSDEEVQARLELTADDLGAPGFDNSFGHGRLDCAAAVELGVPLAPLLRDIKDEIRGIEQKLDDIQSTLALIVGTLNNIVARLVEIKAILLDIKAEVEMIEFKLDFLIDKETLEVTLKPVPQEPGAQIIKFWILTTRGGDPVVASVAEVRFDAALQSTPACYAVTEIYPGLKALEIQKSCVPAGATSALTVHLHETITVGGETITYHGTALTWVSRSALPQG